MSDGETNDPFLKIKDEKLSNFNVARIKDEKQDMRETRKQEWLRKRSISSYICIVYALLIGMEYSCISTSLLFYLQEDVRIADPKKWYGITMGMVGVSGAINGTIAGRVIDKTRRLKLTMITFTMISIAGNLMYTLHYSIVYLLLGRLLCGLCDAAQPVISGEFSRLYKGEELTFILSRYQALYAMGFVIGPATVALFSPIKFQIGTWTLNQNNFIGVFMASLMIIILVFIYFGVHDLSKEDTEENWSNKNTSPVLKDVDKNLSLSSFLMSFDFALLVSSSTFLMFITCIMEIAINVTAIVCFKWSLTRFGIVTSICVLIYALLMFLFANRVIIKFVKSFYMVSFVMNALCLMIVAMPLVINFDTILKQHAHIATCILLNTIGGLTGVVLARDMLFNMVPPSWASYCEGVRSFFSRIFAVSALFSAAWVYEYESIFMPLFTAFSLLFIIPLLIRKRFRPKCC